MDKQTKEILELTGLDEETQELGISAKKLHEEDIETQAINLINDNRGLLEVLPSESVTGVRIENLTLNKSEVSNLARVLQSGATVALGGVPKSRDTQGSQGAGKTSPKGSKRRGRPRKNPTPPQVESVTKKRRGRPLKSHPSPEVQPIKRGRGRPRKIEQATPIKRGRGRPRKYPLV